MSKSFTYKGVELTVVEGDITKRAAGAIVNAANSSLLGGGGVDGAIHRAAGPTVLEACQAIRDKQGKCKTGHTVATTAGNLDAQYIFHTVGPVWQGGTEGENVLLERCYRSSLDMANEHQLNSIAFPAISTGAYRFPFDEAGYIAVRAAILFLDETAEHSIKRIDYVLYGEQDYARFVKVFDEVTLTMTGS